MSPLPCGLAILALVLPVTAQARSRAQTTERSEVIAHVPRVADRADLTVRLTRADWRVIRELPDLDLLLVSVPHIDVAGAVAHLAATPGVEFAEENGSGEGGAILLNDTFYGEQWPLDNHGQSLGRQGADIEALRG